MKTSLKTMLPVASILILILCSIEVSAQWTSRNPRDLTGICTMIHQEQQKLYIGTSDGLFFTSDGGTTMDFINPGISIQQMARNNNVVIVSDGASAIVRSTNAGLTWSILTLPPLADVQGLCFNGSTLFLATYDKGVFKSDDNGDTWIPASTGIPVTGIIYLSINNIDALNNNIFLATARGIFKSTDNGATWVPSNTGIPIVTGLPDAVEITSMTLLGNEIYITPYNNGIYSSTDLGATWDKKPIGAKSGKVFSSESYLFYCTATYGLYRSDNGINWTYFGLNTEQPQQAGSSGGTTYAMTLTENSLLVSTDQGVSWTPPTSNFHPGLTTVFINNSVIYTGAGSIFGGNIQRSANNGRNWSVTPLTATVSAFTSFGNRIFAGLSGFSDYPGGLYSSDNNGGDWFEVTMGFANIYAVNCFAVKNNKMFAGTNVGVFSSTDGNTWSYKGLDNHTINCLYFIDTKLYAGTDAGVFDSPDYGSTWGQTGMATTSLSILSLCHVNNDIYAGSSLGILYYHDSLGIKSWYPANGGIIDGFVLSMVNYTNNLLATTSDKHVYITKNGGQTWGDITGNLSESVSTLIIEGFQIYAATQGTGLWSRDLGDITGIGDKWVEPSVSIYPNPAADQLNIRTNGTKSGTIRIDLINSQGKVIYTNGYSSGVNFGNMQVDCSSFSPGLYSVRISGDDYSVIKKLVIL